MDKPFECYSFRLGLHHRKEREKRCEQEAHYHKLCHHAWSETKPTSYKVYDWRKRERIGHVTGGPSSGGMAKVGKEVKTVKILVLGDAGVGKTSLIQW